MKSEQAVHLALLLLVQLVCASGPTHRATPVTQTYYRPTPLMQWNAWNTFSKDGIPIRGGRAEYQQMAEAIISSGMREAGYTSISTVCTDWIGRDPHTHRLQENTTLWPGGMASFADYLHENGLTLSVYTDAGKLNCCQEPGSLGYEAIDMQTFADWGADYVAVDYCGGGEDVQAAYQRFQTGINASGRPMGLEVYNLGQGAAWNWAPQMHAPFFRISGDIGNAWAATPKLPTQGIMQLLDDAARIGPVLNKYTGNESGTYPQYGQLVVGVPQNRPTVGDPGLSLIEAQSHFSLWCMFPSPLVATNDVRLRDESIEGILMNPETINVNQDPMGEAAVLIYNQSGVQQWKRRLANGDDAVLALNRNDNETVATTFNLADGCSFNGRDLQAKEDVGLICHNTSFDLRPHETVFIRLTNIPIDANISRKSKVENPITNAR